MNEITGNEVVSSDFLKVLLTLKDNIMKSTNVCMIGKVERIDNEKYIVSNINNSKLKISCSKVKNLTVEKDNIVVVLFTDEDNRTNLSRISKDTKTQDSNTTTLHSLDYGIIVAIITGQTIDINAMKDAIASLEKKLSGIDLSFNKGQGIILNANDAQYKLYGDGQSSNIFWQITKNGQTDYIPAQPRRPYRIPIYTEQPASKTDWNYTITFDEKLGAPSGVLFEHYSRYDDYVFTFIPLIQIINMTTVLLGYRDCYINFKNMQVSYTNNSITFKATLKSQDGFKANTQGAYIIW